jgi:N-methylhydantoinase B
MLGALAQALPERIPAASAGTMNNLTIGGYDPRRGRYYSYYETIGGGAGASPEQDGLSAVQLHMTNTLNTPIEALEAAYPFLVRQYAIRDGSSGVGQYSGGNGIARVYEFLAPATVTLVTERRRRGPWALNGGSDGLPGRNRLERGDGSIIELPGKVQIRVQPGDTLVIETPGGGGWGSPRS